MEVAIIGDKPYDVITQDEYYKNKDLLDLHLTAIKDEESKKVYPIRGKNDDRPGIYLCGIINIIKEPEEMR